MRKTNLMLKFSLNPLEFRNSGIYGFAGIETWSTTFCRKKACYICFPYILIMKNTNLMVKFSLDPLKLSNSAIYGIDGIWTRAVLNKFLLYKIKNAVLNLIYSLVLNIKLFNNSTS